MCVIVSGGNRDRCFIINMDQTPVYFSMSKKRTFEVIGKKLSTFARRLMIRCVWWRAVAANMPLVSGQEVWPGVALTARAADCQCSGICCYGGVACNSVSASSGGSSALAAVA
jgi:hypothetical protein